MSAFNRVVLLGEIYRASSIWCHKHPMVTFNLTHFCDDTDLVTNLDT